MQQHSSGVFVLSMGRSGSTLLSRMLQQHPAICSISEYWTSLFMRGFGDPSLSGRDYWALLSVPPTWFGPWVEKARAAGELPAEILYDDARGRYRLRDCPPIAAMTLPALDADPDARVDALAQMVPNWPTAPVTTHSARLFDLLTTSLHKRLWVERSGLSYWYVPDLLQGFPDARYVHLHRDGREVVLSMMGMRFFDPVARVSWMLNVTPGTRLQKLLFFAKRDLARRLLLRVADLERAITRQHLRARPYSLPDRLSPAQRLRAYAHFWANTSELALEAMAKIPSERLLTLKYEQLVSAPRAELSRLIEHLLPGEEHAAWLDAVCALPQPQRARWPDLDPALAEEHPAHHRADQPCPGVRMSSAFDAIPRYTPPYPERPPRRLPALRALLQFGQDALKPFEVGTFSRPFTRRRILGRELVILNHPDWVREAFVKRHEVLQRKTPQMRQALEPLLGDGLFVSDGPLWKARRALVSPLVSGRHLDRFLPIMLETAREWRALWRQHPAGQPIDVLNEMGTLTAEIIARAIFGQRAGREQTDQIVRNFARYQRQIEQTAVAEMLNLPGWIPRFHGRGIRRPIQRIHAVVDHIIDAQLKPSGQASAAPDGCPVGAMIDQLFAKAEGPDASLDRRAVRNEAIVLFMAGHETTANTLAWAFFLLSQAPWARAALARELERIPPERELAASDLDALIYTRAVIEETLRLYPPVPILGRTATADTEIGGERIRQGSLVLVVPWLLHRNPELWERPDDFLPERFLPGAERPSKYQYAPFSVGPRVCPGLAFGLNEAVLCLAVLARAFDWELAPGAKVFPSTRLTLRPGDRLPMLLRERANP